MNKAAQQAGMTLIEVLVAFAILSGILLSVLTLVGQNAQYMLSAEERLLASIATDNLMTEELATQEVPRPGEEVGQVVLAERQFAYTRTVVEIGERAILIEYQIRREGGEQTLARATALKERK
jgi:type II secretion system protein I